MGLFRPYEQGKTESATGRGDRRKDNAARTVLADEQRSKDTAPTATHEPIPSESIAKDRRKSAPTRSRKEAEAARRATMRPKTKKEFRQAEREARWAKRDAQMAEIERRPERTLARNYIDSRRCLLEIAMPLMLIIIVATMFVYASYPKVYMGLMIVSYLLIFTIVGEVIVRWRAFRKLLAARLPRANRRGLLSYMVGRMSQPRRFRTPKPTVELGAKI